MLGGERGGLVPLFLLLFPPLPHFALLVDHVGRLWLEGAARRRARLGIVIHHLTSFLSLLDLDLLLIGHPGAWWWIDCVVGVD